MLLEGHRSGDHHVRDRVFDTPLVIRKAACSALFWLVRGKALQFPPKEARFQAPFKRPARNVFG
jgi:hypothetical protein